MENRCPSCGSPTKGTLWGPCSEEMYPTDPWHSTPAAPETPPPKNLVKISESDMRGVFGYRCDMPTCPICNPDDNLTELAELYERAATPKRESECPWCHSQPCTCPKKD